MEIDQNQYITGIRGLLYEEPVDLRTIEYLMTDRTNEPAIVYLRDHMYRTLFPAKNKASDGAGIDARMWELLALALESMPWHRLELLLSNTEIVNSHSRPNLVGTKDETLYNSLIGYVAIWARALGVFPDDGGFRLVMVRDTEYRWRCAVCHTLLHLFRRRYRNEVLRCSFIDGGADTIIYAARNHSLLIPPRQLVVREEDDYLVGPVWHGEDTGYFQYIFYRLEGYGTIRLNVPQQRVENAVCDSERKLWRYNFNSKWRAENSAAFRSMRPPVSEDAHGMITTGRCPQQLYLDVETRRRSGDPERGERPDAFYGNQRTLTLVAGIMQSLGLKVPQRIKDSGFATDCLTPNGVLV